MALDTGSFWPRAIDNDFKVLFNQINKAYICFYSATYLKSRNDKRKNAVT